MIENRAHFRVPFKRKMILGTESDVIAGRCINLSAGGAFLYYLEGHKLRVGSECYVTFTVHDDQPGIHIKARIKRILSMQFNPDSIPGLGVEFVGNSETELTQLLSYLEECRQNFELTSTLLKSGEPDVLSIQPLVEAMHLPPMIDLGELEVLVEKTLREIELVESKKNSRS